MPLTAEQRDWLTLTLIPGVGTTHFIRLLARFRTATEVLRASQSALRDVVGPKLAERITHYSDAVDIEREERRMAEYGVQLVTLDDPLYPPRLGEIYDPPLVLYVRGDLRETDTHSIAIVGTRRATPYGIRAAERFARDLAARGVTVVSGMATGIDTAAHRGAIEGGGRTIAVLGNGVDVVYPRQNADLMHAITQHGCALSQFSMGTKPSRGHFPYRNRIISGMTVGTLVIQGDLGSGALITAHQALEQGREVFAVPGEIGVGASRGPHALIREGAKLVESADDILVELPESAATEAPLPSSAEVVEELLQPRKQPAQAAKPAPRPETAPARPANVETSESEREVLSVLSPDGSFIDEIAAACRIPVSQALQNLTMLELKGLVRQFSGKRFAPR